jgi:hypothetical protein
VRGYWQIENWLGIIGSRIQLGGKASSHHLYIVRVTHFLFAYNGFPNGPSGVIGNRLCLRYGCTDSDASPHSTHSVNIRDNYFRNHMAAMGLSGAVNHPNDGAITKAVLERNLLLMGVPLASAPTTGIAAHGLFTANATELTMRDCLIVALDDNNVLFDFQCHADLAVSWLFYRNRIYRTHNNGDYSIEIPRSASADGDVKQNVWNITGGNEACYRVDSTSDDRFNFNENWMYHPTNGNIIYDTSIPDYINAATWQMRTGTPDDDLITGDPGWIDPSSGIFDSRGMAMLRDDEKTSVENADSLALGSVAQNTTLAVTLLVFNKGRRDNLSISSATASQGGTITAPSALISPFVADEVLVSLDTSTLGPQTVEITITSNDPDSPFKVDLTYTVT